MAKFVTFVTYAIIVFSRQNLLSMLYLSLILVGVTLYLRLPLRTIGVIGVMIALLLVLVLTGSETTIGGRLLLAIAKVVCLTMMVRLFSMTTSLNAVLQFLRPSRISIPILESAAYMLSTILAVFPSIQYDLRRAMDAETIRRGKRIGFHSMGSWVTIVTVVLVRTMNRAERFTDTVWDRGYVPSQGLTPIGERSLRWQDIFLALLYVTPGLFACLGPK